MSINAISPINPISQNIIEQANNSQSQQENAQKPMSLKSCLLISALTCLAAYSVVGLSKGIKYNLDIKKECDLTKQATSDILSKVKEEINEIIEKAKNNHIKTNKDGFITLNGSKKAFFEKLEDITDSEAIYQIENGKIRGIITNYCSKPDNEAQKFFNSFLFLDEKGSPTRYMSAGSILQKSNEQEGKVFADFACNFENDKAISYGQNLINTNTTEGYGRLVSLDNEEKAKTIRYSTQRKDKTTVSEYVFELINDKWKQL